MHRFAFLLLLTIASSFSTATPETIARKTKISIAGMQFYVNGQPTFKGRYWNGYKIEGLLPNARMVQGIFDDENHDTRVRWAYPDTKKWDAERNTSEFISAMAEWKKHGLVCFTINLQGGSPEGYSKEQPWKNSAFDTDGSLKPSYMSRLRRILNKADELGMIAIVGYFYFGQDQHLKDEKAVIKAVDNATKWLLDGGYTNVLVEINNECNINYNHEILQPPRVHELINRVKGTKKRRERLLVSTSYGGGSIPQKNVVLAADFILLHGNGQHDAAKITDMVQKTKNVPGFRTMPIVFNEDDHFEFDKPVNNFVAATSVYASWGYFDFRMKDEGFDDGYQSVPVNWRISSPRKKAFFEKLKEITGGL